MGAGWTYVALRALLLALHAVHFLDALDKAFAHRTEQAVLLLQALAFVEVLHAANGMVKGSPMAALAQNLGRDAVLFLFVAPVTAIHTHWYVKRNTYTCMRVRICV
jgi:hypothetical protein